MKYTKLNDVATLTHSFTYLCVFFTSALVSAQFNKSFSFLLQLTYLSVSLSVGAFENIFSPKKGRTLCKVMMHIIIWANQKTESFVYGWLHAHAMFDVTCFPTFVRASEVISRVLSIFQWWYNVIKWNLLKFLCKYTERIDCQIQMDSSPTANHYHL